MARSICTRLDENHPSHFLKVFKIMSFKYLVKSSPDFLTQSLDASRQDRRFYLLLRNLNWNIFKNWFSEILFTRNTRSWLIRTVSPLLETDVGEVFLVRLPTETLKKFNFMIIYIIRDRFCNRITWRKTLLFESDSRNIWLYELSLGESLNEHNKRPGK